MKVATLKEDLANGEVVQQDFVRLSQKLQVRPRIILLLYLIL